MGLPGDSAYTHASECGVCGGRSGTGKRFFSDKFDHVKTISQIINTPSSSSSSSSSSSTPTALQRRLLGPLPEISSISSQSLHIC
jgi:hypothetical protein